MSFWNFTNKADEPAELRIEGDIVSDENEWIYEWLGIPTATPNKFKAELKKYANQPITIWIDSYGGDVFAAAGIYNALMEHKGAVTVKIDGKAMSAASVIAMAGTEVHMSPVAMMMIHNPLTYAEGDMHDMRHTADVLDEVKESIINAYQLKTGKSRAKIAEMMDNETWMSAKAAIKDGFADKMLYKESDELAPLNFSRLAIVNSTAESMRKLIEVKKAQGVEKEVVFTPDFDVGEDEEDTMLNKAKLQLAMEL